MKGRARIQLALTALLVTGTSSAWTDKIHLKSGNVETGWLKEPAEDEFCRAKLEGLCCGKEDVQLILENGLTVHCLKKSDVRKVDREIRKPAGIALLAQDRHWGKPFEGKSFQIIPQQADFSLGQPMRFALVLKNAGKRTLWFDGQGLIAPRDVLKIVAPDGKEVLYKTAPFQTMGVARPVHPKEIVVVFENWDITQDYAVVQPGRHSMELRGDPSTRIHFEVAPGLAENQK